MINRHESYVAEEVFRILKSGGHFITQQCGGYGGIDLIEWCKGAGTVTPIDWTAAVASRQLKDAGFQVTNAQEVYPEYSFLDVGAVVYYLRAVPWHVEDFSIDRYRDRLLAIHQHIQKYSRFPVKDQRFLIEATRQA